MTIALPFRLANGPGNPPDARKFMGNYDWLTAMLFGNSTQNGGFEYWTLGTSFSDPANGTAITANWTYGKSGTSSSTADVTQESTNKNSGTYAVKIDITGAGSSDSLIDLYQSIANPSFFAGRTILVGIFAKVATASKVRVKVTDGTTTQYSSYHTGGNTFEHLQVLLTVGASVSAITVSLEIVSDFTGAVYIDDASVWLVPAEIGTDAQQALIYTPIQIQAFNPMLAPDGTQVGVFSINGDIYFAAGYGTISRTSDGKYFRHRVELQDGTYAPIIEEVILS